jgi:protein-L-isoaspartate O-methyltransferase
MNTYDRFERASKPSFVRATPTQVLYNDQLEQQIHDVFVKLALFVAQAWQDERSADAPLSASSDALTELQACVSYVATELSEAGGVTGLEISTGAGFASACTACKQVLSMSRRNEIKAGE